MDLNIGFAIVTTAAGHGDAHCMIWQPVFGRNCVPPGKAAE